MLQENLSIHFLEFQIITSSPSFFEIARNFFASVPNIIDLKVHLFTYPLQAIRPNILYFSFHQQNLLFKNRFSFEYLILNQKCFLAHNCFTIWLIFEILDCLLCHSSFQICILFCYRLNYHFIGFYWIDLNHHWENRLSSFHFITQILIIFF